MDGPLISVIIPVYNVERYLEHCVMSVRGQVYGNLEIILVDDGSTDSCGRMCDEFAKADSRIRVIHKENGGLSSARNAGLDAACGELIAFVDSDDYVHPEYISRLYEVMVKTGAGLAMCGWRRIFSNDIGFRYPALPAAGNASEAAADVAETSGATADAAPGNAEVMDYAQALEGLVGPDSVRYVLTWNKLYKREIFSGLRFPEGKISEDFYVSFKVLHRGGKIAVIREQLYYYYLREGSIISSRDDVSDYNIEALDEFDEYTAKLGIDLRDKSLFIRCNSVMEDYWAAWKNKNKARMQVVEMTFEGIKARMDASGVPLNHKARLFAYRRPLFVLERGLIDLVGSIKIRLNLYR